ncbi:unnamed protein product [Candidula unifasciata]|uniref:Ig-like domain-containing protein n=1 Tax=Candidula unifasciata TaxID=100452 RepID=A0A8S3YYQ6_9EUPU|nr:unnamed protein product [Candidula unifasciata]
MERLLAFLTVFSAFVAAPAASIDNVLEIKPVYTNYLLRIGATQELNCSVNTTEQNAKLLWTAPTMDGVTRKAETTVIDNKITLHSSLRIDHFTDVNAGDYKCSLEREGELISEAVIHLKAVKEEKSEPIFVLGMKTATLSCDIEMGMNQNSDRSINWYKNENLVTSRKDSHRFTIVDANNSLIIQKPTREDAGLYVAKFSIPGRSHPYECHVHFRAGPLVLDFEKSKNLIEGDDMELHCVVKGYPYAVVTWYKDTSIVNASTGDDNRVTLRELHGHKNARLFVRRVNYDDAGDYMCEAYSSYFPNETSSKRIRIRIKDKLAALWPFLGIVGEVVLLCIIIFIYERRRSKQVLMEDNAAQNIDGATVDKKEGLRHRNTNNPSA